ncbi:pentapeptide repeat-containing protein [Streptomyces sp. NPDC002104]
MTSPSAPSPLPSPVAPEWPHCGEGAGPADPVGCRGRQSAGLSRCMAHFTPAELTSYLGSLSPGDDVEHQGVTFSRGLTVVLLNALWDPATEQTRFGKASFDHAVFVAGADFEGVVFAGDAGFQGTVFAGEARFGNATFRSTASFVDAKFASFTWFVGTTFHGEARFGGSTYYINMPAIGSQDPAAPLRVRAEPVTFEDQAWAWFHSAVFHAEAHFDEVVFPETASFDKAVFHAEARFSSATFHTAQFSGASFGAGALFDRVSVRNSALFIDAVFSVANRLGPLLCQGSLNLSRAVFGRAVTIEAIAESVTCTRTVWESTATLRLRYADVDLSDAVITQPFAVTAHAVPFPEMVETGAGGRVRVLSLRGVDAAQVVLTGTDLSACRFIGAFHLDQLRLGGDTVFARTPAGTDLLRVIPLRWTDRLALAEEHHWRALPLHRRRLRAGWVPDVPGASPSTAHVPGPAELAALYRQLRKGFEDGKDEPGAADFYYAEMEMRRLEHRSSRNRAERGLLTAYWALSGYGLRASRALVWLGLAMAATVLFMMLWGLPQDDPKPVSAGRVVGQNVRLVTDTPDPVNPSGPLLKRLSAKRFEKSLRVVVNSVVFRSSGQNLTTVGTYAEMASRLTEPVLLGFAALAVRGRVKR